MTRIEIVRNPNPLVQWQWVFWYYENRHALVLDYYATLERPTKRHKFQVTVSYTRLARRGVATMTESEVLLLPEIVEEARVKFNEGLRIVRWSEVSR